MEHFQSEVEAFINDIIHSCSEGACKSFDISVHNNYSRNWSLKKKKSLLCFNEITLINYCHFHVSSIPNLNVKMYLNFN